MPFPFFSPLAHVPIIRPSRLRQLTDFSCRHAVSWTYYNYTDEYYRCDTKRKADLSALQSLLMSSTVDFILMTTTTTMISAKRLLFYIILLLVLLLGYSCWKMKHRTYTYKPKFLFF